MGLLDKLFSKAPPSRDDFAQLVIQALAANGVPNVRYDQTQFTLHPQSPESVIFLENSYATCCQTEKALRPRIVADFARAYSTTPAMPSDYAAARAQLMPIIRDPAYFGLTDLQLRSRNLDSSEFPSPHTVLAPELQVFLAYDSPHNISHINHESFAKWNVPFAEALAAAKENLRDRTDPKRLTEVAPGIFLSEWGDSYDSSRILLTDMIYRLALEGEPVAFIPNRDQLFVTGSNYLLGLKKVLEYGSPSHFAPNALSPNLYLLRDGNWIQFIPIDPELFAAWSKIKRQREGADYNQQRESLAAIYEREKTAIFVASYKLFKRKDGSDYSACVWTNGLDSLLPKTEVIVFLTDIQNKTLISVPWDAAAPILGSSLRQDPSLVPIRFRANPFPSDQQLLQLRAAAI